MPTRYAASAGAAALITFGLFFLMQTLVIRQEGRVDERKSTRIIDFVRLKRASELEVKKRELPQSKLMEEPPPAPEIETARGSAPDLRVQSIVPAFDLSPDLVGGPSLAGAQAGAGRDTDIVPLVRVNPMYPIQAAERGIEGWVEVEFTITPQGTVADARVVAHHPSGVFDTAALQAIRKWKYKPKVENGVAVARTGARVKLNFELED
jgi:protein TonB